MNRCGFLKAILATGVAPYVCTAAGVLMPVRQIATLPQVVLSGDKINALLALDRDLLAGSSIMEIVMRDLTEAIAERFDLEMVHGYS